MEVHAALHYVTAAEATRALSGAPPFGPARLHTLAVGGTGVGDAEDWGGREGCARLAAALRAHHATCARGRAEGAPSVAQLRLHCVPLDDGACFAEIASACAHIRLADLLLSEFDVTAANAAHLFRLICAPPLKPPGVAADAIGGGAPDDASAAAGEGAAARPWRGVSRLWLLQGAISPAAAPYLCASLRASSTLTELRLVLLPLWSGDGLGPALFRALIGHATLVLLKVKSCEVPPPEPQDGAGDSAGESARIHAERRASAGASIAELLLAPACRLSRLVVTRCSLGDAGASPLFASLRVNGSLRNLDASHNGLSASFARDVAVAAVAANTGLRKVAMERSYVESIRCPDGDAFAAAVAAVQADMAARVG